MEFCDPALPGREDTKVLASRRAFQAGTRHRRKVTSSPPICFLVYNSVHIVVLYAVFQYIHIYIYIPCSFRLLKFQLMICYDICFWFLLIYTYFILSYLFYPSKAGTVCRGNVAAKVPAVDHPTKFQLQCAQSISVILLDAESSCVLIRLTLVLHVFHISNIVKQWKSGNQKIT